MKVIFTSETKEDFRKHNDYVRKKIYFATKFLTTI